MNRYAVLADMIVAIHFSYVSFVVLGLPAIGVGGLLRLRFIRNFWFRITHLAMILIVAVEAMFGIMCPLTTWEYRLRVAAGQDNISDASFIGRMLHNLIFVDFSRDFLGVCYCLFGLTVLASWWFVPPTWPFRKKAEKVSPPE